MQNLSVEQVAERLHIHVETVRQRIREGLIPAFKPGKRWVVREDDLEAYEATLREKADAWHSQD